MAVLVKFLRLYLRSKLRGGWRITDLLSKNIPSLQCVPIEIEGGVLYADLRIGSARGILASPSSESGENNVITQYVREADTVFDIGAHLGFYSLQLAKSVGPMGRVYVFEPNLELLPSLRKTLDGRANVKLFEVGLSDKEGELDLFVPEDASMASLIDWTEGDAGPVHKIRCKLKVLDEMVAAGEIEKPNFIKCDVEGAELSVFSGAKKILNRSDAPIVLFELNRKAAASFGRKNEDYLTFFESLELPQYEFFEVFAHGLSRLQNWDVAFANVLAVPASRQQ